MRKAILTALAAAASVIPAASAQRPLVNDGPYPVPDVRIHRPGSPAPQMGPSQMGVPQAGTSWSTLEPASASARRTTGFDTRDYRNTSVEDVPASMGLAGNDAVRANRYPDYRAIQRGGTLPGYFASPRYDIADYDDYGFSRPAKGLRWVRYYDDALLVDRSGRVLDGRYGMDFDRYGDDWGYDDRGIPAFAGDLYSGSTYADDGGDYNGTRDSGWAQRIDRDYDRDYPFDGRYGGAGVQANVANGYAQRPYGNGGYVMIETITTTVTGPSTVVRGD